MLQGPSQLANDSMVGEESDKHNEEKAIVR